MSAFNGKSAVANALQDAQLGPARLKLARALAGRTVDLLVNGKTIVRGVVSGARMAAGKPKVIVDGSAYDLDQVLTAATDSTENINQPTL